MTREIKFRVWDKEHKTIYGKPPYKELFITNLDFVDNKSGERGVSFGDYLYPFLGSDRYELMQFTGLLDKNGKEIYEGDIVELKYYNSTKYYKKAIIKAEGITYKAYLEDGDKWDNDYSYEDWSDNWELCDHILIVGNIYETPELLNNKD